MPHYLDMEQALNPGLYGHYGTFSEGNDLPPAAAGEGREIVTRPPRFGVAADNKPLDLLAQLCQDLEAAFKLMKEKNIDIKEAFSEINENDRAADTAALNLIGDSVTYVEQVPYRERLVPSYENGYWVLYHQEAMYCRVPLKLERNEELEYELE